MNETPWHRYGLIVRLAEAMPSGTALGRTALMKLIYFLQIIKGVPLGYHFSLYTYGPFDSEVLADLTQVQERGGVVSKIVYYPRGYGYEIEPGEHADSLRKQAEDFLGQYDVLIEETIKEFGTFSPATLELASTLVFASREEKGALAKEQLIQRVKQIKPRFTTEEIQNQWEALHAKGYLAA